MGNNERAKQKASDYFRAKRCNESSVGDDDDPRLQEPSYRQARELWKKFIRGEITGEQLSQSFGGLEQDDRQEEIKSLFNAKEL